MPSVLLLAQVTLALASASDAQTDPAAVVRASDALLERARTVQGSYQVVQGDATNVVNFVLEKPYLLSLRSAGKIELFDGREHVIAHVKPGTYESRDSEVFGTPYLIGFTSFLKDPPQRKISRPEFGPGRLVNVEGRVYVRRTSVDPGLGMSYDIDPETKLPARWSWNANGRPIVALYRDVVLNEPVPAGTFDLPGAKQGRKRIPTREETMGPAVGSAAPNLNAITLQNRRFDLHKYAAEKRLTVLAFVDPKSLAASNGIAGLANLVRANDLRDVGVVAVVRSTDVGATRRVVRGFFSEPVTLSGAAATTAMDEFGVSLVPTFVVVDPAGTVVGRFIGFNEAAMVEALAPPAAR